MQESTNLIHAKDNTRLLKNDLLLRALRGEPTDRPPVWMMRQAGRYLPEYLRIRDKYDFFTRVQTPELVAEITLQPIDIVGTDAAILFSDILVVPQAMGLEVRLEEGNGPLLPKTIKGKADLDALIVEEAPGQLSYVYDAIKVTKELLDNRVPLIGFAGAPWTILCYMVEGKGSKIFEKAKAFCYQHPQFAERLLDNITEVTIEYLKRQVNAGVNCVQVFDSWAGLLDKEDFAKFSLPYLQRIACELRELTPVIVFAKGVWHSLPELAQTGASALGVDWGHTPQMARNWAGSDITLQGSYDPAKLLQPVSIIRDDVHRMIDAFGPDRYIVNLGHGIIPQVPVEHAKAFVEAVKEYERR